MELIKLDQVIKDIEDLGADETSKELILNNVRLYNNLVLDYTLSGIEKNLYLTYQLNVQISKQILELRKQNPKPPAEEEGGLMDLVKKMKDTKNPK